MWNWTIFSEIFIWLLFNFFLAKDGTPRYYVAQIKSHSYLGDIWQSYTQLHILKTGLLLIFFSQTPQLREIQVYQKHGSSAQIYQIHGAPQEML
jgi:hypothetical protein